MASGSPQSLPLRAAFLLVVGVIALVSMQSAPEPANAQTHEATVRLTPAVSYPPIEGGLFSVFLVAEDLSHHGSVGYDDDRDTVPDRFVESDGLAAFQVTVQYDENVVSFVDAFGGPELDSTGRRFQCLPVDKQPNQVTFGCVSTGTEAGPQGTLTLATMTFSPVRTGSSPLAVSAQLSGPLGTDAVPAEVMGGVASVVGRPAAQETATVVGPGATTPANPTTDAAAIAATATSGAAATQTAAAGATEGATQSTDPAETPAAGGGDPDDGSGSSAMMWGAIVGGLSLAGLLVLGTVVWQRQRRAGV